MKVKKTRRHFLLFFSVTVLALFLVGGIIKVVLGETTPIEVSLFCQYQNGQIYAVNDTLNGYTDCKKNGRLITVGMGSTIRTTGFLSESGWYLDPNGQVWFYNCNSNNSWVKVTQTLPVDVSAIVQWNGMLLIDTNQRIWKLDTNQSSPCVFTGNWSQLVSPQ